MRLIYSALALLARSISAFPSTTRPITQRYDRLALLALLAILPGILSAGSAGAQIYVPPASRPVCDTDVPGNNCGGSRSRPAESDEDRRARLQAMADARAERKAESDRQKAIKDAQKLAKKKAQEEARQQAENDRLNAIASERAAAERAEQQRQLEIDTQRRQAAFDAIKPKLMSGLKGVDGATAGANNSDDGLGLKGLDDTERVAAKPAWDAQITDPQAAKIAHHLGSFVPPLPIPKEEVALDWKKVYLNDDRLMNTADLVMAAWETTGVLGEPIAIPCKALLIGGKSFIAQEDGAYLYLVKKDADYDAALAYLKDPAKSQAFAHLVQDVRQNRPLPATADPAMVKAARAITDPKLGSTAAVVWDSMTSKEALSAMLRKAWIETATEMLSPSTEGLLRDEAERKAMFDAVRLDRTEARKMMEMATTDAQRAQYKALVEHADSVSATLYRLEKVNKAASDIADEKIGENVGDMGDVVADHFLGSEPRGRE